MRRLVLALAFLSFVVLPATSCIIRPPGHRGYRNRNRNCQRRCVTYRNRRTCAQRCEIYRNGVCVAYRQACSNRRYCARYATRCY